MALGRIEVEQAEIAEAKRRRAAIADALRAELPGIRIYYNGSIAHGDALTPLTDVDLGGVVPDPEHRYGPGRRGPTDLKQRAADAIREKLRPEYGELRVEVEGRKRSILVRFRDPVAPGRPDFTADVIIAIDNPSAAGLYMPRWESWDRSDPEEHTRLVHEVIDLTDVAYARIVRLVKHWLRTHDKPICSWHAKALALGCIRQPLTLLEGLRIWFRFSAAELRLRDTPDPAGVAPHALKIKDGLTRFHVVRMLEQASERLERAVALEREGYPQLAVDELAKLFNDEQMLPRPDQDAVRAEEARRVAAARTSTDQHPLETAAAAGVGEAASRPQTRVRSWAAPTPVVDLATGSAATATRPSTSGSVVPAQAVRGTAGPDLPSAAGRSLRTAVGWYGGAAAWWVPFERDARRRYGADLQVDVGYRRLVYRHRGIEVPGRADPVPVLIEFVAAPQHPTYGRPPQDFPRVFADVGALSPHRMPDRGLCLYFPGDPPELCWNSERGLLSLLDLVRNHLFYELHWRATGGQRGGVWLGDEAPHGLPRRRAA